MITKEYPYLRTRAASDAHSRHLLTSSQFQDVDEIDKLIQALFTEFPPAYPTRNGNNASNHVYSKLFYNTPFYKLPTFSRGFGGREIPPGSLIQEILTFPENFGHRNSIFHIIGDVGTGKSAFADYLITNPFSQRTFLDNYWLIKLNTESLLQPILEHQANIREQLTFDFLAAIVHACNEDNGASFPKEILSLGEFAAAVALLNAPNVLTKRKLPRLQRVTRLLIKKISTLSNKRPVFIIDNLDFIAHIDDRGQFMPKRKKHVSSCLHSLFLFTVDFLSNRPLGTLSSIVLFITRPETYHLLASARNHSVANPFADHPERCFRLKPPQPIEIFRSRSALIDKVLPLTIASRHADQLHRALAEIEKYLFTEASEHVPLSDFLFDLVSRGYRDFIRFARLCIHIACCDLLMDQRRRLFFETAKGKIAFLLWQYCAFNQRACQFPNIFLVDATKGANGFEHRHSYWLKYLLGAYVVDKHRASNAYACRVPVLDVLAIFCGDGPRYYDEALVLECLGSLSEANVSGIFSSQKECVADADEWKINITSVESTPRGEFCFRDDFFFSFPYLQLAVEDHWLPLPRGAAVEAVYEYNYGDYSYLVQNTQYIQRAGQMIRRKAMQVLLFLEILETAWKEEFRIYAPVFQALAQVGVAPPNFQKIRADLTEGLGKLENIFSHWNTNVGTMHEFQAFISTAKGEAQSSIRGAYRVSEFMKLPT